MQLCFLYAFLLILQVHGSGISLLGTQIFCPRYLLLLFTNNDLKSENTFFGTLYSWVETNISLLVLGSSGVEKIFQQEETTKSGFLPRLV